MIHIVFQRPDTESLKKSFELDASLQGDIIQIEDDFAAGPLKDIFSTEGWEARREWWRAVLAGRGPHRNCDHRGKTDRPAPGTPISAKPPNETQKTHLSGAPPTHTHAAPVVLPLHP